MHIYANVRCRTLRAVSVSVAIRFDKETLKANKKLSVKANLLQSWSGAETIGLTL